MKSTFKNFETPLNKQIYIFRIPKDEEKKVNDMDNLFNQIIVENFSNLGRDVDIHLQKAYPNRHDQKRVSPLHIIVKLSKT
jgi:hypothetical protein